MTLIHSIDLFRGLVSNNKFYVSSSDGIYLFELSDMRKSPVLISDIENIKSMYILDDKSTLIILDTVGNVFKVDLINRKPVKKYSLANNPNGGRIYLQGNIGITADIKGNVFCIDFEHERINSIKPIRKTAYYSVFSSREQDCFLLQGVEKVRNGDLVFIKKCCLNKGKIEVLKCCSFGDFTLPEIEVNCQYNNKIYFIDCHEDCCCLFCYDEVSQETEIQFQLERLDNLKEIISYYCFLDFCPQYKCFVIARTDCVQFFSPDGRCLQEIFIGRIFENSVNSAYILNDKVYINTIAGMYEENIAFC